MTSTRIRTSALAGAIALSTVLGVGADRADAAPLTALSSAARPSTEDGAIRQVHWRGGWGYRGGWGWGGAALAGALIGSALAAPYAYGGYYGPAYYGGYYPSYGYAPAYYGGYYPAYYGGYYPRPYWGVRRWGWGGYGYRGWRGGGWGYRGGYGRVGWRRW